MSIVFKCDRKACGETNTTTSRLITVKRSQSTEEGYVLSNHDEKQICEQCAEKLQNWLNEEKTKFKEEE